jgi:type I restriction enzyme S subunit
MQLPKGWIVDTLANHTYESRMRLSNSGVDILPVYGVDNVVGLNQEPKYVADELKNYKVISSKMFAYNPMRLNIGSIGYCSSDMPTGLVSPDYVVFGCNETTLSGDYLQFVIRSHLWKSQAKTAGSGSVRTRIYYADISEFLFPLPPLAEQRAIAAILGTWDEAIDLTRRLIEALKQRKQALMQLLLTGEVRFPGFDGDWEEVDLGSKVKAISGGTPSKTIPEYWNGNIPWISARAMHKVFISDVEDYISVEAARVGSKIAPARTVFILVRGSMLYNRVPVSMANYEVAFNQDVKALITDDEILPEFLLYALINCERKLLSQIETTGMGAGKISTEILLDTLIPKPSIEEQTLISQTMLAVENEIDMHEKWLSSLQTQKRGLMQKLLTGQVQVKVEGE